MKIHLSTQSALSVICVSGPHAQSFLHNITTGEVNQLGENQIQLNGLCNIKGRIVCLFYLMHKSPGYKLIVPDSLKERIVKLLNMYKLRAEVDIDAMDGWNIGALSQVPDTQVDLARPDSFPLGIDSDKIDDFPDFWLAHMGRRVRRSILLGKGDIAATVKEIFDDGEIVNDENAWRYATIADAQPWLVAQNSEKHLAQSLDLDREPLAACSLDKGCYPGQEIIARMHYLGKRKRGLCWAKSKTALHINDLLYPQAGERECATVLDSAAVPGTADSWLVLAEVNLAEAQKGQPLRDQDGNLVELTIAYPGLKDS